MFETIHCEETEKIIITKQKEFRIKHYCCYIWGSVKRKNTVFSIDDGYIDIIFFIVKERF